MVISNTWLGPHSGASNGQVNKHIVRHLLQDCVRYIHAAVQFSSNIILQYEFILGISTYCIYACTARPVYNSFAHNYAALLPYCTSSSIFCTYVVKRALCRVAHGWHSITTRHVTPKKYDDVKKSTGFSPACDVRKLASRRMTSCLVVLYTVELNTESDSYIYINIYIIDLLSIIAWRNTRQAATTTAL